jgi:hypothetical protein
MPAKNPRLTITLKPALAAQFRQLSQLTGNSQSALIGDLLEGSEPVLARVIQVLEAAQVAKQSIRGRLAEDMDKAQAQVEGALGVAMEGFHDITGALLKEAEAVTKRAPRQRHASAAQAAGAVPGAASPTPISNRGVRLDPKATKTIATKSIPEKAKSAKVNGKSRGGKNDPL